MSRKNEVKAAGGLLRGLLPLPTRGRTGAGVRPVRRPEARRRRLETGGKRKRRSPTGDTPEGKADRRDSPGNQAAAPDTAGPSIWVRGPSTGRRWSAEWVLSRRCSPVAWGSPSASEPGWVPPGLWDPSGRRPRAVSLSASPASDSSASRSALEAARPVHSDHKTAARLETHPSPGRSIPSSPHPQSGALRCVGELGSIDPRARGVTDPLPDPRTGASPSSARPPCGGSWACRSAGGRSVGPGDARVRP